MPDFAAPNDVDHTSLTFGRQGDDVSLASCHASEADVNDVNEDGLLDLVCDFTVADTDFHCEDTEGILRGTLVNGTHLEGTDSVLIEPCSN
jgi:hypothetical protein